MKSAEMYVDLKGVPSTKILHTVYTQRNRQLNSHLWSYLVSVKYKIDRFIFTGQQYNDNFNLFFNMIFGLLSQHTYKLIHDFKHRKTNKI
jgi:hypothetical protein